MHDDAGVLRHIERFRAPVRTGESDWSCKPASYAPDPNLIRRLFLSRKSIAERVSAKCYGRAGAHEFLLAFRASVHCICQKGFKVVDVKVDMNGRPVSLISTNLAVCSLSRFAPADFSISPIWEFPL